MSDPIPAGFYAVPASDQGYPVVVLHPWWGLNGDVKDFCLRLADAGFAVLAPDLYDGRLAVTIAEAEALSNALDGERAKAQVADAVRSLATLANRFFSTEAGGPYRRNSGVAVVGFSLGAFFALDVAAALPDLVAAVVLYYGTGPADFAAARAAYLGHFAAQDPYEPAEAVDWLESALTDAGRPATFYRYPATGHWFAEPGRTDAYNAAAADLAWERTVAFLRNAFA